MDTNIPQPNIPMGNTPTPITIPIVVKIISILFYLVSITLIVFGIMAAFVSSLSLPYLGSFGLSAGLVPGIATIAWGVLSFLAGRGLWSGREWGKVLAITISSLYIIFGIVGLIMFGTVNYFSLIINLIIIAYLIFSKGVSAAFQKGNSTGSIVTPAAIAIIVYAIMVYPSLTPQQTALNQVGQLANQLHQQLNTQNTPSIDAPDPIYGPVVQPLGPAGVYSNTNYGFNLNIPFSYSVHEKQYPATGSDGIIINGTQTAMIAIVIEPTNLSLKDAINKYQGDLIINDTLTNTTIAGIPAIQDTGNPNVQNPNASVNIYYLLHNGNYYMFQKTGSFKTGQLITDDQFNSAIQSLQFTK